MSHSLRFLNLVLLLGLCLSTSGCILERILIRLNCPSCNTQVSSAPVPISLAAHDPARGLEPRAASLATGTFGAHDTSHSLPAGPANVILKPVCAGTAVCGACLFPGGGHFYTGETMIGAALLGAAAGSVLAGALLSSGGEPCQQTGPGDTRCVYNHDTHDYREPANRTPLYVGAAIAAGSWIYGIVDARSSAARMNARNGFTVGAVEVLPEPLLGVDREGRPELGVRLRLSQ